MKGNSKSVRDLIEGTRIDRENAMGSSKYMISAIINEIKAIGRLIDTNKELNKQNQNLEKTNIALQKVALILGFIAALSVFYQFFKDWLNPHPVGNFLMAIVVAIFLAALLSVWVRKN